jgi:hypothetical protein
MTMRRTTLALMLTLAACTSAEEKAREREKAMIEAARADAAEEAAFVADSIALTASITVDSIRDLRIRDVKTVDDNGYEYLAPRHEAIGTAGQVCAVTTTRYFQLVRGDTLRCQWGPPE